MNELLKNKIFQVFILVLCVLLVFISGFWLGLRVGEHQRGFARDWSDNYHKNFAGPRGGFLKEMRDHEFINANGVFGQIIKIEGTTVIAKGEADIEKIIMVSERTIINRGPEKINVSQLQVDDNIIVVGEPDNQGRIMAKLIRVMPPKLITPTEPAN